MDKFLLLGMTAIILLVFGNYLLTFAIILKINARPKFVENGLPLGSVAPTFSALTLSGEEISNAYFTNRGLLLLFLSPNCASCLEVIDKFLGLIPLAKENNVEVFFISIGTIEETNSFANKYYMDKSRLIVTKNGNTSLAEMFKTRFTPSFCYIDKNWRIDSSGYPGSEESNWTKLITAWESRNQ